MGKARKKKAKKSVALLDRAAEEVLRVQQSGDMLPDESWGKTRLRDVAAASLRYRAALLAAAIHYRAQLGEAVPTNDCCRAGEGWVFRGLLDAAEEAADPKGPWSDPGAATLDEETLSWARTLQSTEWLVDSSGACTRCGFLAGLELGMSLAPHSSAAELEFARLDAQQRANNARGHRQTPAHRIIEYVLSRKWTGEPPTTMRQLMERIRSVGEEGVDGSDLENRKGRWSGEARIRIGGRIVSASGSSLEKAARKKVKELVSQVAGRR